MAKQAKAKREKAEQAKEVKQEAQAKQVKELTTKDVAAMLGMTPKALRRKLRAKWYNDGVHTNYLWKEDDPILKEILETLGKKEQKKA